MNRAQQLNAVKLLMSLDNKKKDSIPRFKARYTKRLELLTKRWAVLVASLPSEE
jgi:hypothetical protein